MKSEIRDEIVRRSRQLRLTIWMPHGGDETHLGWQQGIFGREGQTGLEEATLAEKSENQEGGHGFSTRTIACLGDWRRWSGLGNTAQ